MGILFEYIITDHPYPVKIKKKSTMKHKRLCTRDRFTRLISRFLSLFMLMNRY